MSFGGTRGLLTSCPLLEGEAMEPDTARAVPLRSTHARTPISVSATTQKIRTQLLRLQQICDELHGVLVHIGRPCATIPSPQQQRWLHPMSSADEGSFQNLANVGGWRREGRCLCDELGGTIQALAREVISSRDAAKIGIVQSIDMEFQDVRRSFLNLYSKTAPAPPLIDLQGATHIGMQQQTRQNECLFEQFCEERGERADEHHERYSESALLAVRQDFAAEQLARERLLEFQRIQQQLIELAEVYQDVAAMVHRSSPMIDSIESNVNGADAHVKAGIQQLSSANKLQMKSRAIVFPLVGIVLGGVVAGPVGAIAGLKGGAVLGAAALGGASGFGAGMGLHKLVPKI